MAGSGGSNLKSVLSGGMGSRLVISDHGQEAELLSRHLMYLCSHSMPHVRGVLLGTVSAAIRHQGTALPLSGCGLPLVLSWWTRVDPVGCQPAWRGLTQVLNALARMSSGTIWTHTEWASSPQFLGLSVPTTY